MSAINRFLLEHNLRIATNPCVSPDFCLDWQALRDQLRAGKLLKVYPKSRFETKAGRVDARSKMPTAIARGGCRARTRCAARRHRSRRTARRRFPRRSRICSG